MEDPSRRSILITLRVNAPEDGAEAVVRAARYDFSNGDVVQEILDVGRVQEIIPLVQVWLRSFLDQGDPAAES